MSGGRGDQQGHQQGREGQFKEQISVSSRDQHGQERSAGTGGKGERGDQQAKHQAKDNFCLLTAQPANLGTDTGHQRSSASCHGLHSMEHRRTLGSSSKHNKPPLMSAPVLHHRTRELKCQTHVLKLMSGPP